MHYTEVAMRYLRGQRAARIAVALVLVAPSVLSAQSRKTGEAWQIVPQPQSSEILARDGALIGEVGSQIRTSISISVNPPRRRETPEETANKNRSRANNIAGILKPRNHFRQGTIQPLPNVGQHGGPI